MYRCPRCGGLGFSLDQSGSVCPACLGREVVKNLSSQCDACAGTGRYNQTGPMQCPKCKGAKVVDTPDPYLSASHVVPVDQIQKALAVIRGIVPSTEGVSDEVSDKVIGIAVGLLTQSWCLSEQGSDIGSILSGLDGGEIIITVSGIWHARDGRGAKIISFVRA